MSKLRKPCDNCPWRVDAPRGHWANDHFESIYRNCQDDGQSIMLCHKASAVAPAERIEHVCQGWLRVIRDEAIGVRIALMRGYVTEAEMLDTKGPELFGSFKEMLEANKIRLPKRNRYKPHRRRSDRVRR